MSAAAARPSGSQAAGSSALPGVRTFGSPRFRLLVAALLAGFGVLANIVFLIILDNPIRPWGEDFEAYYFAAQRVAEGLSPYTSDQLASPVDAVCPGCYLYPPLLAQLLVPVTALPLGVAVTGWFALNSVLAYAAVWLALSIGGAARSMERALWSLVAVTFYFPVFQSNWLGNVSTFTGLLAVLVAAGGTVAGLAVTAGLLLKLTPAAWAPAVLVGSRSSRLALLISLSVVLGVFVLLAPAGWLDYPAVLRNLLAGSGEVDWNLGWAVLAQEAGLSDPVATLARASSMALAVAALAASAWVARRAAGMPAAAVLGTATLLLLPGTFWYHYLAVLLPLAALAWPRAGRSARAILLLSAAVVSITGIVFEPLLAQLGAAGVLVTATRVLWPGAFVHDRRPSDGGGERRPPGVRLERTKRTRGRNQAS